MTIVNLAAGQIAIAFKAQGLATCPVTACAGGTNAIGDAFRNIRDGYLDVTIAGGCEASITPLGIGGLIKKEMVLSWAKEQECLF